MTDDICKELEAALPCLRPDPGKARCSPCGGEVCFACEHRATATPLIERLVAERDKALAELGRAIQTIKMLFEPSEVEMEAGMRWLETGEGEDPFEANELRLKRKLAAAEALLARRPHVYLVREFPCVLTEEIEECDRLGGACAK